MKALLNVHFAHVNEKCDSQFRNFNSASKIKMTFEDDRDSKFVF